MNILDDLREYRLFGLTVIDFVLSYIVIYFIWLLANKYKIKIPLRNMFYSVLPLSFVVHLMAGVDTEFVRLVTVDKNIVAIGMLVYSTLEMFE